MSPLDPVSISPCEVLRPARGLGAGRQLDGLRRRQEGDPDPRRLGVEVIKC